MNSDKAGQVLDSPEFKKLVAGRWSVSLALTLAMFVSYFGFILVLAFDKSVLAQKIGAHLTLGIPIGVGVIVFAWVLTGLYVWWANGYYDKAVTELKGKVRS
jgi:uncharacterized membrane protein (DUF485 family)